MASISYIPQGVCARKIDVELDNGIVTHVQFTGGCHGNAQAVARLVQGMTAADIMAKLSGIDCKGKGTSCADQLSRAIHQLVIDNG